MSRLSRIPCVAGAPGGGGWGPETTGPPRGTSCPSDPICTGAILQWRYGLVSLYGDAHPARLRKGIGAVVPICDRKDILPVSLHFFIQVGFSAWTWFPCLTQNATNTPRLTTMKPQCRSAAIFACRGRLASVGPAGEKTRKGAFRNGTHYCSSARKTWSKRPW